MRCDDLPLAVHIHPDVGEAVTEVIRFPFGCSFLVVRPGDDRCIAVHANIQPRHFGNLDAESGISVVRDVA